MASYDLSTALLLCWWQRSFQLHVACSRIRASPVHTGLHRFGRSRLLQDPFAISMVNRGSTCTVLASTFTRVAVTVGSFLKKEDGELFNYAIIKIDKSIEWL